MEKRDKIIHSFNSATYLPTFLIALRMCLFPWRRHKSTRNILLKHNIFQSEVTKQRKDNYLIVLCRRLIVCLNKKRGSSKKNYLLMLIWDLWSQLKIIKLKNLIGNLSYTRTSYIWTSCYRWSWIVIF